MPEHNRSFRKVGGGDELDEPQSVGLAQLEHYEVVAVGNQAAVSAAVDSNKVKAKGRYLPATCHICEKIFPRKSHMNDHVKSVHLGQRIKCELCDKTFSHKNNLHVHMKKHK